jgi:peptidoglycan hydrolase-like protein with peptidoglycan-binding domain
MNYTGLVVNGYYDADTVSAVKRFQKNHGYTQDGKVDSTMYNAIKSALSVWRNKSVESPKNVDFYPVPERSLKYDSNNIMTGEDVKYVQAALIEMNYDGIAVTGKYDASTAEAVKRFQTNHNLYVDGIVGKETSAALVKYLNAWRNR